MLTTLKACTLCTLLNIENVGFALYMCVLKARTLCTMLKIVNFKSLCVLRYVYVLKAYAFCTALNGKQGESLYALYYDYVSHACKFQMLKAWTLCGLFVCWELVSFLQCENVTWHLRLSALSTEYYMNSVWRKIMIIWKKLPEDQPVLRNTSGFCYW